MPGSALNDSRAKRGELPRAQIRLRLGHQKNSSIADCQSTTTLCAHLETKLEETLQGRPIASSFQSEKAT